MLTFKDYRRSRLLTQSEVANLLGVSRDVVRTLDRKPSQDLMWWIEAVEKQLDAGPHPFIKRRTFHPQQFRHMPNREIARLRPGYSFLSLEYWQPDRVELSLTRPEARAFGRACSGCRVLVFRTRSRAGWETLKITIPIFQPLADFTTPQASNKEYDHG
jgi:transcriptional regulator with XRE-family HTH domain